MECEKCKSPAIDEKMANIYGVSVCDLCQRKHPEEYNLITKTAAIKEFLLTAEEMDDRERLPHMEKPNPHKSTWHNMQLFLRKQVSEFAIEKHGSLENLEKCKEEWVKTKVARKEKRYSEKLAELRKKTRADNRSRHLSKVTRHTHAFVESSVGKRCTECGYEIKYEV
jgi:DNA-repair protein complementing XP-A cells